MTTTVEEMATAFKQMGTPFIVGHPGGESVELMEATKAQGMRFILMKQEVAGSMLAATWGEITGSPGVCLSTRGPGATNMVKKGHGGGAIKHPIRNDGLTDKQRIFVKIYAENEGRLTPTECARQAGYAEDRANTTASELLNGKRFPKVVEAVIARRAEIEKRLEKPAMKSKIDRLTVKMLPKVRKAEMSKKRGGQPNK